MCQRLARAVRCAPPRIEEPVHVVDVERVLYRTTIKDDVPVGPDGFRSQIVEGREFGAEVPEPWQRKQPVAAPATPARKPVPVAV